MLTPASSTKEILMSLTKEELVGWILQRFPFFEQNDVKDAYWYALQTRFDKLSKRQDELLNQARQTEHIERKIEIHGKFGVLGKKIDHILKEMERW